VNSLDLDTSAVFPAVFAIAAKLVRDGTQRAVHHIDLGPVLQLMLQRLTFHPDRQVGAWSPSSRAAPPGTCPARSGFGTFVHARTTGFGGGNRCRTGAEPGSPKRLGRVTAAGCGVTSCRGAASWVLGDYGVITRASLEPSSTWSS
jgi:hypothetical protein